MATNSFTQAAEAIGDKSSTMMQVSRWSQDDYPCPFHCPWHGWLKLRDRKQKELSRTLVPVEEAKTAVVMAANKITTKLQATAVIVRSDLERLSHLEYIYSTIIEDLTGIPVSAPNLVNPATGLVLTPEELKEFKGLTFKNKESAIRSLALIVDQINRLKAAAGLQSQQSQETSVTETAIEKKSLTFDDVKQLQYLYNNTSPEQREALRKLMESENAILEAQVVPNVSDSSS